VDDQRTLNKSLYLRPPENVLTFNQLVSLWENKIKSTLEKVYIPEDQLLKNIQGQFITTQSIFVKIVKYTKFLCYDFVYCSAESPFPTNFNLALGHSLLVKGDCTNFEIDPSFGVEGSQLYPEVKYTTVDDYLNAFVWNPGNKIITFCELFKSLYFCHSSN